MKIQKWNVPPQGVVISHKILVAVIGADPKTIECLFDGSVDTLHVFYFKTEEAAKEVFQNIAEHVLV